MHRISITSTKVSETLKIALATLVILWFVKILWNRRKWYIFSWKTPGPLSFPIIGSLYKLTGSHHDIIRKMVAIQDTLPELAKFWFGPQLLVVISGPENIDNLVSHPSCLGKGFLYDFLVDVFGTGLLTAPVQKWKKHRRIIAPSFNMKMLESFVDIFAEKATILGSRLEKCVGQEDFNLFNICSNYFLDGISETALGTQMHAQNGECSYTHHLDRIIELLTYRAFRIWLHPNIVWGFTAKAKQLEESRDYCRNFSSQVIRKRVEAHRKSQESHKNDLIVNTDEATGFKKVKPSLDLILESSHIPEEDLKSEVSILLFGGTDTNASAMIFLLIVFGIHPDIQEKVYQEALDVLGPDRKVEKSDLPRLTYTEMVIKETLRIFPVAPYFLRYVDDDIDIGDTTLPKDAVLYFPILKIHRDPENWPDPLKFDPNRFLPENVAKRHPCTYIPFSMGIRNCIGLKYAMMNIKTTVATLVRRLRFSTDYRSIEEVELKIHVMLRPAHGHKIKIHRR